MPAHQHIEFAAGHWDGVDRLYLFNAYGSYRNKCGSCHYLYKPSQYKLAEWNKILPEMKVKSKMTDEKFDPLRKYVLTLSQVEITK